MTNSTTGAPESAEEARSPRGRRVLVAILAALNGFVLGGCAALLIINRLLIDQLDIYAANQSVAAGSVILDFMDDLTPIYLLYGGVLILLVLGTATVLTWSLTRSWVLRLVMLLLFLLLLAVIIGLWFGGVQSPIIG